MVQVDLLTKDGGFVVKVQIPPFTPPAEVLQWGSRFFVYNKEDGKYYEGLCFFVISDLEVGE